MADQEYSRLALAQSQLETALSLFLDEKNYCAAITLAGAAEEMFGKALKFQGIANTLESWHRSVSETHLLLRGAELDQTTFFSKANFARNALKHLQSSEGPAIILDLEESACWMLVRAIHNGKLVGLTFARANEFDEWFCENVVGV